VIGDCANVIREFPGNLKFSGWEICYPGNSLIIPGKPHLFRTSVRKIERSGLKPASLRHYLCQLDCSYRISPFIVVPGEYLDQCSVDDLC